MSVTGNGVKIKYAKIFVMTAFILAVFIYFFTGCPPSQPVEKPDKSPAPPKDTNIFGEYDAGKAFSRANDLEKNHKLGQARKLYEEIIDKAPASNPLTTRARTRLGRIYNWQGEYEPAIRELRLALKQKPDNPNAVKASLAYSFLAADRPDEALKLAEPALDPYCRWKTHVSLKAQALYALYVLHNEKKYIKEMETALEKGVEKYESPVQKEMLSASLALVKNRFKNISKHLGEGIEHLKDPRDKISSNFLMGVLEYNYGEKEKSLEYFKTVWKKTLNSDVLNRQNFMDGFYAYWTITSTEKNKLEFSKVKELLENVPGGPGDPELADFITEIEGYASALKDGDHSRAIAFLDKMLNGIKDESIEGDYFYDSVYKPYILFLLYRETGNSYNRIKDKKRARQFWSKARNSLKFQFPPKTRE